MPHISWCIVYSRDRTNLRKTQAAVSKSIEELQMQQRAASSRSGRAHTSAGGSRSGSRQQTTMYDTADNMGRTGSLASIPESTHDNSNQADHHSQEALAAEASAFFMPKKKILRSDGASLHDVYLSKRGDTWGQILKAQAREDVRTALSIIKNESAWMLLCVDGDEIFDYIGVSIHFYVHVYAIFVPGTMHTIQHNAYDAMVIVLIAPAMMSGGKQNQTATGKRTEERRIRQASASTSTRTRVAEAIGCTG